MTDWHVSSKGNFTTFDYGHRYTVFRTRDDVWQVAHELGFSRQAFDCADQAKAAVEDHVRGVDQLDFRLINHGWKEAKKGGYYRRTMLCIETVKQSKTGSWYVTVNGELLEGQWFDSPEEAQAHLTRNSCFP